MSTSTIDKVEAAGDCCCPVIEVRVQGALDLASVARLSERLYDALSLKPSSLVVDLSQCPFFDAVGINLLVEVHRQAWRQQADFSLRGCSPRHLRVLALMGLHGVFEVDETGTEAAVAPTS